MAVTFTITKPSDPAFTAVTGNIGDTALTDTNPAEISREEAVAALTLVRARRGADVIPEGEYANYSIQIGTATVTLARLKEIAEAAPLPSPPPPTSSTRQGLQLRIDGRGEVGGDFGHSGLTWELAPGVTHTFPSDWYFGGELGIFGRPEATGPSPSEMSLLGLAPRVVGGHRIAVSDNGEWQLRLEGSLGYRLFRINSPEDQHISTEQQGRINDASSGGRGFAGTNPEPQDTRLGRSGICAEGLCLQREGFGHGPEVGITPAIEWTPTDGSWGLRVGGRGTLGYSSAEVDGHNRGDPGLPLSGGNWSVMGLIGGFFGGTPRTETPPRSEESTPSPSRPITDPTARTAGETMTLTDEAAVRTLGHLGSNASILGVQFDSLSEDTTAPYEVAVASMTEGQHEIKIRYRNPGDTEDTFQTVVINVDPAAAPEPVEVTDERTVTVAGTNVVMTPRRTYPRQGSGDATIVLLQASQAKAVFIKLDNGAEERVELQANTPYGYHVTEATLGGMAVDSAHNVTVRIDGDTQSFSFPFTVIAARPPVATLSVASVPSNPPSGGVYINDPIRIRVTSDIATRAQITVGNHTQDVDLAVGVNNITMTGAPKTWDTGATAGQRGTFTIQIQPADGSAVDVGQVTIKRAGGGTRSTTPPPARPVP